MAIIVIEVLDQDRIVNHLRRASEDGRWLYPMPAFGAGHSHVEIAAVTNYVTAPSARRLHTSPPGMSQAAARGIEIARAAGLANASP